MLRRLLPLALALCPLASRGSAQDLEVWFLDVGQADATLLVSPTGGTFLLDAGDNGAGNAVVHPFLQSLGISTLDYVGVSHYHADHLGGLDEIWDRGIRATVALDRGTNNTPGTQSYSSYANRYAGVRQTVQPGQIVNLGGGVTLTCLVVEGQLMGGGSVNISGSSQWENSASVAWLVEYGDFDLFLGGDLTGGGNSTTDVETSVAPLAGNVDVYQANHHGSRTSTNQVFVNFLQPEFTVFPCGSSNIYGYPKQEVVNRLSNSSRTTPLWSLTDGTGQQGYVDAGGHVHLTTDGSRYTIAAEDGTTFTAHVDEQAPSAAGPGSVVVAEIMRDPTKVSDTDGEWIELTGVRINEPVSVSGVTVSGGGPEAFVFRTSVLLGPGDELLIAADGLPARNGGIRPILVWPAGEQLLSNSSDEIRVASGATTLDQVNYDSGWAGGAGVSAERMDLEGPPAANNFAPALSTYGLGDRGTPGLDNDNDTTGFNGSWVELLNTPTLGGTFMMNWHMPGEAGALYQGFATLSTTPGYNLNGTHIPANQDAAWRRTTALPGWSGFVPASGLQFVDAQIPNAAKFQGLDLWILFYTYKDIAGQGIDVRTLADPVPVTIQ